MLHLFILVTSIIIVTIIIYTMIRLVIIDDN